MYTISILVFKQLMSHDDERCSKATPKEKHKDGGQLVTVVNVKWQVLK